MNVRVLVGDDVADIRRLIGAIIAAHDQKIARSRPGLRPHGVVPSSSPKFRRGVGDFVTPVGVSLPPPGFVTPVLVAAPVSRPALAVFVTPSDFVTTRGCFSRTAVSRLTASPRSIRIGTEPSRGPRCRRPAGRRRSGGARWVVVVTVMFPPSPRCAAIGPHRQGSGSGAQDGVGHRVHRTAGDDVTAAYVAHWWSSAWRA